MRRTANLALVALLGLALGGRAHGQGSEAEAKKLVDRAQELVKAKQFDEAADLMKKAVELLPNNDQVLAMAAQTEHQAGRFADALKHALQAVKLNDKAVPYYVLVALSAHATQDLKLAREYLEKVLAKSEREVGPQLLYIARQLDDVTRPHTYTIRWELNPQRGRLTGGGAAVALPRGDLPYQSATYEVKGARTQRLVKGEANHILYVTPAGFKPFQLTTKITVQPHSYKKELEQATDKPIPAAVAKVYLGPCESINPRSPALAKVVAGLKSQDRVETARNILAWMKKNIDYKNQLGFIDKVDFKTVEELLQRGHAECRGYAMLFTALCRAAGIPARPVWGLIHVPAQPGQAKDNLVSHTWAEVYFPGSGWIPVDPQHPESLGWLPSNILRLFMDVRRSAATTEHLPELNLMYMNGNTINFEVSP